MEIVLRIIISGYGKTAVIDKSIFLESYKMSEGDGAGDKWD